MQIKIIIMEVLTIDKKAKHPNLMHILLSMKQAKQKVIVMVTNKIKKPSK